MRWREDLDFNRFPAPVREFVISIVALYVFILFCTWGEAYRIWDWEVKNRALFGVITFIWPVIASLIRYDNTKRFW